MTPELPSRMSRRRRPSRRRAIVRGVALGVLFVIWMGIGSVGGPLIGRLSEVQQNDSASFLPRSAESTRVAALSERFSDTSSIPLFVVVTRPGQLTDDDRAALVQFAGSIPGLTLDVDPAAAGGRTFRVGDFLTRGSGALTAVPSEDGAALLLPVPLDAHAVAEALPDGQSAVLLSAQAIRSAAQDALSPQGLRVYVTGPAGLLADLITAFSGIDGKLLAVSLTAVFIILLLVYRSPLLPVAALLTSAFGLGLAALVIFPLARNGTITMDGQSQGILSILVIGAATDYALLLVSRYREELHDESDKFRAMRRAWRGAVEPIAASAATVILGLLCLMLSELGSTRGLGPVGALGIAGALLAALTMLPVLLLWPVLLLALLAGGAAFGVGALIVSPLLGAVLAVLVLAAGVYLAVRRRQALRGEVGTAGGTDLPWYARAPSGRWLFWPRVPRVDHRHHHDTEHGTGLWERIARLVGRRPRTVWATTLGVLLVAAAFAPTLSASGVSISDTFRSPVESVRGQRVLAEHFPAGAGSPAVLVVQETDADQALDVVQAVPGVASARVTPDAAVADTTKPAPRKVVNGQVQIEATLRAPPDSPAAEDVVRRLRGAVDSVGQDVLVGGPSAVDLDVRDANRRDLMVIVPAILVVIAIVLMLLLRAVVAPLLLIGANLLSFGATIGVSALVFDHLLDFPGGDPAIPLYAFVFLVALGIDYSIFLMTRAREESFASGTRPGLLAALAVTGGVITSAGLVLAATFGTLSTIPLLFLQQMAFIVAFGVLLDTFVVRSLLVPALAHQIGPRIWWPSRLAVEEGADSERDDERVAG